MRCAYCGEDKPLATRSECGECCLDNTRYGDVVDELVGALETVVDGEEFQWLLKKYGESEAREAIQTAVSEVRLAG